MASPRPVPVSFVEKYGSKILAMSSAAIPLPVSLISTRALLVFISAVSLIPTVPPLPSMASRLFIKRLVKTERSESLIGRHQR